MSKSLPAKMPQPKASRFPFIKPPLKAGSEIPEREISDSLDDDLDALFAPVVIRATLPNSIKNQEVEECLEYITLGHKGKLVLSPAQSLIVNPEKPEEPILVQGDIDRLNSIFSGTETLRATGLLSYKQKEKISEFAHVYLSYRITPLSHIEKPLRKPKVDYSINYTKKDIEGLIAELQEHWGVRQGTEVARIIARLVDKGIAMEQGLTAQQNHERQ